MRRDTLRDGIRRLMNLPAVHKAIQRAHQITRREMVSTVGFRLRDPLCDTGSARHIVVHDGAKKFGQLFCVRHGCNLSPRA